MMNRKWWPYIILQKTDAAPERCIWSIYCSPKLAKLHKNWTEHQCDGSYGAMRYKSRYKVQQTVYNHVYNMMPSLLWSSLLLKQHRVILTKNRKIIWKHGKKSFGLFFKERLCFESCIWLHVVPAACCRTVLRDKKDSDCVEK